jgi:hypothetical protein
LNQSKLHCDIKKEISSMIEKKDIGLEKAILVLSINIGMLLISF